MTSTLAPATHQLFRPKAHQSTLPRIAVSWMHLEPFVPSIVDSSISDASRRPQSLTFCRLRSTIASFQENTDPEIQLTTIFDRLIDVINSTYNQYSKLCSTRSIFFHGRKPHSMKDNEIGNYVYPRFLVRISASASVRIHCSFSRAFQTSLRNDRESYIELVWAFAEPFDAYSISMHLPTQQVSHF